MTIQIKILDSIEIEMSPENATIITPSISYPSVYWRDNPFGGKTEHRKQAALFTARKKAGYRTYTGLLTRIINWCKNNNLPVEVIGSEIKVTPTQRPTLSGINLRNDQLQAVISATKYQRGVIKEPTGVGKTIVQLGFLSRYPQHTALILAHTTAIVTQTFKKMKEAGFKNVEMLGAGEKFAKPTKQYTIATMQSFVKLDPKDYCDFYDIVIVDEIHHVRTKGATYDQILSNMLAPIRLGFTATLPPDIKSRLVMEGLIGPIIYAMSINEAANRGLLAKPKLKLIRAKAPDNLRMIRKYADVYEVGIVSNDARNIQIAQEVKKHLTEGKSILIFVIQIEHGNRILEALRATRINDVPFVQGSMPIETREAVKSALIKGKIKCCIATVSWLEGVDIPNLDVVVLASLGKAEIRTLQGIGRGLRKTNEKGEVLIIDFLDLDHKYLTNHTGERLGLYSKMDWL